jgi:hypothetical protein
MLFYEDFLKGVKAGQLSLAFRRWNRARVKVGTRLRTQLGVVEVLDVAEVNEADISESDAKMAGYTSRGQLFEELSNRKGQLFRVDLKYAGRDERIALRNQSKISATEFQELKTKLAGYERKGAWTRETLELIVKKPATLAAKLANSLGLETQFFKRRVRRLKELGLTESLEVGYRISPRGKAYLRLLDKSK